MNIFRIILLFLFNFFETIDSIYYEKSFYEPTLKSSNQEKIDANLIQKGKPGAYKLDSAHFIISFILEQSA